MLSKSVRSASQATVGTSSALLLDYLPILIFMGVALLLSILFVFLPIAVSHFTGTRAPDVEKLSNMNAAFVPSNRRVSRSMSASIWSPSCSSFSIWKPPSSSPGRLSSPTSAGKRGAR